MKLKEGVKLTALAKYGFELIDAEQERYEENYVVANYALEYVVGFSRRGQHYSILVDNEGNFSLYATEPDGSGGAISLKDDIFFQLISDGIVEPTKQ